MTRPLTSQTSYTSLDRILDRLLDYFDELDGTDFRDPSGNLDRRLANLEVLQRRIIVALWLFGDTNRASLLGFPSDPETQRATLEECAGDTPSRFVATFTIDGETHEMERMALCRLQATVEFRYHLIQRYGARAELVSVRPVELPLGD